MMTPGVPAADFLRLELAIDQPRGRRSGGETRQTRHAKPAVDGCVAPKSAFVLRRSGASREKLSIRMTRPGHEVETCKCGITRGPSRPFEYSNLVDICWHSAALARTTGSCAPSKTQDSRSRTASHG